MGQRTAGRLSLALPVRLAKRTAKQHASPCSLALGADIEDITQKTGNYKRFPVFVKMLRSAINRESDSVFVDLLTYSDLVRSTALPASSSNKKVCSTPPYNCTGNAEESEAISGWRGRKRGQRSVCSSHAKRIQALPHHDLRRGVRPSALPAPLDLPE